METFPHGESFKTKWLCEEGQTDTRAPAQPTLQHFITSLSPWPLTLRCCKSNILSWRLSVVLSDLNDSECIITAHLSTQVNKWRKKSFSASVRFVCDKYVIGVISCLCSESRSPQTDSISSLLCICDSSFMEVSTCCRFSLETHPAHGGPAEQNQDHQLQDEEEAGEAAD